MSSRRDRRSLTPTETESSETLLDDADVIEISSDDECTGRQGVQRQRETASSSVVSSEQSVVASAVDAGAASVSSDAAAASGSVQPQRDAANIARPIVAASGPRPWRRSLLMPGERVQPSKRLKGSAHGTTPDDDGAEVVAVVASGVEPKVQCLPRLSSNRE
jgi:hypothetical protein